MSLPKLETAKTGRSTCRGCGEGIVQGTLRLGVEAFVSGRVVVTWQHPICALRACYLERCVASRGKCKATGEAFKKGDVRLAVCSKDVKTFYACRADAMGAAMRPVLDAVEDWCVGDVRGFEALTGEERAAVEAALGGGAGGNGSGGGDDGVDDDDGDDDERKKRGGRKREHEKKEKKGKRDAGDVDADEKGGEGKRRKIKSR